MAHRVPQRFPSWILGGPTFKGKKGEGREGVNGREGKERGTGRCPRFTFLTTPLGRGTKKRKGREKEIGEGVRVAWGKLNLGAEGDGRP